MEREILLEKLLQALDNLPQTWEEDALWLIRNFSSIEKIFTAVPEDLEALQALSSALVKEKEVRLAFLCLYQKLLLDNRLGEGAADNSM